MQTFILIVLCVSLLSNGFFLFLAFTAEDQTKEDKQFALVFSLIAVSTLIALIFHSIKNF